MAAGNPVKINGLTFPSLRHAAKHYGKNYGNVARRVHQGWPLDEALDLVRHVIKQPSKGKKLKTSTGNFDSVRDAALHFGIKEATVHRRLALGWTPDQAVEIVPHERKPRVTKEVICAGQTYPNNWALAKAYGKAGKLVAKRIRQGWTTEQAVGLVDPPPRFRDQIGGSRNQHWKKVQIVNDKEYPATELGEYKLYVIKNNYDGKEYVGITITPLWQRLNGHKRAAKIGVKSKLYNAMRFHGSKSFVIKLIRSDARSFSELQQQEADEIARRDTIKNGYNVSPGGAIGTPSAITVGGRRFPSRSSAASYFGINLAVFNLRVGRLNWTPEQAAEIEPRRKYARQKVEVSGKRYSSLKQAAEAHGLNYHLVWERINEKKWTLEQALSLQSPPDTVKYRGIALQAFGKTFSSYAACAKYFSIKSESLRQSVVERGASLEEAINHLRRWPKAGAQSNKVVAFGKTYESITKLAEKFGLSVHSIRNRIRYQGATPEDAVQYLRRLKKKK